MSGPGRSREEFRRLRAQATELRGEGLSAGAIAARLEVPHGTVRSWLWPGKRTQGAARPPAGSSQAAPEPEAEPEVEVEAARSVRITLPNGTRIEGLAAEDVVEVLVAAAVAAS